MGGLFNSYICLHTREIITTSTDEFSLLMDSNFTFASLVNSSGEESNVEAVNCRYHWLEFNS